MRRPKFITVRYRLHLEILYQDGAIEIPQNLPTDDQTLQDHCYNVLGRKFRHKVAAFYLCNKKYTDNVAKKI